MNNALAETKALLSTLRLPTMQRELESLLTQAREKEWTPLTFLTQGLQ